MRDLISKKKLNTAAVAEGAGLKRVRVRKILSGAQEMTVDELFKLSQALDISPNDLGFPTGAPDPDTLDPPTESAELAAVDPWGNQPQQLLRIAFELGCDVFLLLDADSLGQSNIPDHVLGRHKGRELPIKLDAAYHKHNNPRYSEDTVTLTLSFDALYECELLWSAFRQVIFFPAPPEPPDAEEPDDLPKIPHLRLV